MLAARARCLRLGLHDSMLTTSAWPDSPKARGRGECTREKTTREGGRRARTVVLSEFARSVAVQVCDTLVGPSVYEHLDDLQGTVARCAVQCSLPELPRRERASERPSPSGRVAWGCMGGCVGYGTPAADPELRSPPEAWPGRMPPLLNHGSRALGRTLFCRLALAPPDSSMAIISVRPLLAARCKHTSPVNWSLKAFGSHLAAKRDSTSSFLLHFTAS